MFAKHSLPLSKTYDENSGCALIPQLEFLEKRNYQYLLLSPEKLKLLQNGVL